jgi:hypothetical protein
MPKTETHFEQIPVAEVVRKIAEEEVKVEEKRPAAATSEGPLGSTVNRVDRIRNF